MLAQIGAKNSQEFEFGVQGVGRKRHGVARVGALLEDRLGDEQRLLVVECSGGAERRTRDVVVVERLDEGHEAPVVGCTDHERFVFDDSGLQELLQVGIVVTRRMVAEDRVSERMPRIRESASDCGSERDPRIQESASDPWIRESDLDCRSSDPREHLGSRIASDP